MPSTHLPAETPSTDAAEILTTIEKAFASFNAQDFDGFLASWDDDVVAMINQAPPYVWTGQDVIQRWLEDSTALARAGAGLPTIAVKRCVRIQVTENSALVVLIVTMTVRAEAEMVEEDGAQISVVSRTPAGWRVKAMAYGGGLETRMSKGGA